MVAERSVNGKLVIIGIIGIVISFLGAALLGNLVNPYWNYLLMGIIPSSYILVAGFGEEKPKNIKGDNLNIYARAWRLFLIRLEDKTGWGKEELKRLMLDCLLDAGETKEEEKKHE